MTIVIVALAFFIIEGSQQISLLLVKPPDYTAKENKRIAF
jgi:hypothetical protein